MVPIRERLLWLVRVERKDVPQQEAILDPI